MNRALFLDRDGVINIEKNYLFKIEECIFIKGIFEICRFFQQNNYYIIIITNQAGIAKGYYTEKSFHDFTNWMDSEFKQRNIEIAKVFYCPHHTEGKIEKYRINCDCRKPNPGMIFNAKTTFNLDLQKSLLIGDKESDIESGINAGLGVNFLLKGYKNTNYKNTKANYVLNSLYDLKSIVIQDKLL